MSDRGMGEWESPLSTHHGTTILENTRNCAGPGRPGPFFVDNVW
jgi:hypothetical protein